MSSSQRGFRFKSVDRTVAGRHLGKSFDKSSLSSFKPIIAFQNMDPQILKSKSKHKNIYFNKIIYLKKKCLIVILITKKNNMDFTGAEEILSRIFKNKLDG